MARLHAAGADAGEEPAAITRSLQESAPRRSGKNKHKQRPSEVCPCAERERSLLSRLRSVSRKRPGVWCIAAILLISSSCSYAFEAEMCTGNCSYPAHQCGLVPAGSWLADYVPSIMKVCRCDNYTMAGRRCDTPCPHGHSNPCNGHGECLYSTATCACDFGWQGVNCTAECPKTYGSVCASKGTCVQEGLNGAKCECFPGFRGGNCTVECVGGAARPCSKRGICEEDGSCTCLGGWRGEDCSIECPGSNVFPCTMHGKCMREVQQNPDDGSFFATCQCDPLYRGKACEFRCPDVLGIPCGGRGMCNSNGECECNYGFRGKDCMSECPGGASNPCNGHGKCTNSSICECSQSWAGEKCDDLCPGGLENPCSGHGKCVTSTGNLSNASCICDVGDGTFQTTDEFHKNMQQRLQEYNRDYVSTISSFYSMLPLDNEKSSTDAVYQLCKASGDACTTETTSLPRWEGYDCSQRVYDIAKVKNNKTISNVTGLLYPAPQIWPSIIPPIVVLLAIVTVILSRLISAYAHAKEMRIQQLNNEIAKASGLEPIHE